MHFHLRRPSDFLSSPRSTVTRAFWSSICSHQIRSNATCARYRTIINWITEISSTKFLGITANTFCTSKQLKLKWCPCLGQNVDQVDAQLPLTLAIANVHIRSASEDIGLGLGKTCCQNQMFRSQNSKSEVCGYILNSKS